jgi:PAS domain S-box-containing protein
MKTKPPLSLKVQLAFWFAISLLFADFISYRRVLWTLETDRSLRHTHDVLEHLQSLFLAMQNVEVGYRGFVLTDQQSALDAYHDSIVGLARTVATIRDLTSDNPTQQRQFPALERQIDDQIGFGEMAIGLRRTEGLEAAANAIRDGPNQRTVDKARDIGRAMQDEELRLLAIREEVRERRFRQTRVGLTLGMILGVLIAVAARWSVQRERFTRRLAEEALENCDEKYRILVDTCEDHAIFMLDPQGQIVSWNVGAERMSGYTPEQAVGRNFSCFFSPEDIQRGRPEEILRVTTVNGRHEEEGVRVRKDGTRFLANVANIALLDPAGNLRGFCETSHDLSRNKESEAKYRGLLEAAPDAMVVVNRTGEIVLLNLQAEKQFGYRRDELVGQQVKNIIPEGFAERLIADAQRSAADALAQQIGTGIELTGRRKDSSEFPIEIMLSPLESTEGILVTAAIRDISVRKEAEAHLLTKLQELNRSNVELAQFAYLASHDLQEPLRMVASYTQLLSRRYKGKLDSDADEFIAFAVDGASRMHQLIQDLLAYSRVGTKGRDLLDISSEETLRRALVNLRGAIEETGALVTHGRLPTVHADEMQLIQLFQNLVGNAIKYHNSGIPRVHISAMKNVGKKWIFSVQDNGLGIDSQYFEKIFGMFQRLHKREEFAGTGIGLAICKKIVERHGGGISVESHLGEGSTFRFDLAGSDENSGKSSQETVCP